MAQWRQAAVALAGERARELASMTDAEALAAAERVLELAGAAPLSLDRVRSSGLVYQQALFHRRRLA
jgi:hypothetical protein